MVLPDLRQFGRLLDDLPFSHGRAFDCVFDVKTGGQGGSGNARVKQGAAGNE